ncbi:MAG: hypothetical protein N2253_04790 [Bacteroidia bacterium]|nr:hypothetical protein [Bacteroidia bacterium]MCX7764192.1 hypothetical protein [Bacteroidia bacterium]
MDLLYLGRYQWRLNPPLTILQRGSGRLSIFLSPKDTEAEAMALLEKITAAVGIPFKEALLISVQTLLTKERLSLFSDPLLWVMGESLSEIRKIGVYDARSLQAISPPQGLPSQGQYLYVLPSLSDMLKNPELKKVAWRWLQSLSSRSSR